MFTGVWVCESDSITYITYSIQKFLNPKQHILFSYCKLFISN